MDRRTSIKWVLAAGAAWPALGRRIARAATKAPSGGYGTDPNLIPARKRGEFWPLTLTAAQRQLAAILADIIIPADEHSPGAAAVGVIDFIDEWVSAPYPTQREDSLTILAGFSWLDDESGRRHGKAFSSLDPVQQAGICDAICSETSAAPEHRGAARFFALFRDLTAGGFYTTPVGRKDLNYVGNVPLTRFDGPDAELLRTLGLP
jgi:gluconate 2-dehydrogenase subunit 3-like protein